MAAALPVSLAAIQAARERLAGSILRTPLVRLNVDDGPAERARYRAAPPQVLTHREAADQLADEPGRDEDRDRVARLVQDPQRHRRDHVLRQDQFAVHGQTDPIDRPRERQPERDHREQPDQDDPEHEPRAPAAARAIARP